jgi:hypothetical protein
MRLLAAWNSILGHVIVASLAASLLLIATGTAQAQVPANEQWQTITTRHFRVHFTAPLELQARHAASVAERAYSNLETELVRPRGVVDIILSDGTDGSNGSATVTPRPQIIIYARPPVDEPSLESYDDWTVLVLQHELTHIFHLDRSRGWWRGAQAVFGRNPVLFPNYYTPSWLTEGLAVYYESRFTSGGRLHGSFETAVARSAAADHLLPQLSQLSLATTRFPYGQSAYVYGSFIWDEIARSHGDTAIPAFIERSSEGPIPFFLDSEAELSFGETFTNAWKRWRDSVAGVANDVAGRDLESVRTPAAFAASRATVISNGGRFVVEPRWRDNSTIVFVADNGRESPGLYQVRPGSQPVRIARRNSLGVNDPSRPGEMVFAQGEYIDRFHTRGDLYSRIHDHDVRLTHDARLSEPSARADGGIVAVQTVPSTTRLVRVSRDGRHVEPITAATIDTQWTAPRWSPDGTRIVAVRITGAPNEIVILDTAGTVLHIPVRARAVLRSPAWTPDGRSIVFTSDLSGVAQLSIVSASADFTNSRAAQLTGEPGGVAGVDVVAAHDDSVSIVTTVLRGDGYHLVTWTVSPGDLVVPAAQALTPATRAATRSDSAVSVTDADPRWQIADDTSKSEPYSPWRTLMPSYWSPTFAQTGDGRGLLIGALTGASDVIGRHSYVAQAAVNLHNGNVDASLSYEYNRWANPMLSASIEQYWSYSNITGRGVKIGDLGRRSRFASLHATFARPRVRTYSALTIGAEFEEREYATDPTSLLKKLDPFYTQTHSYPTLVAAAVYSNTQRPVLSISPEDGISITGSLRQRWESSSGVSGRSFVAVGSGYKSLDLPGFAHHVVAVRAAIGAADRRSPSEYEIGGVSGSSFEVVPGVTFGNAARTFPVRGFAAGAEAGINAVSFGAEYRVPIAAPSTSLGLFPFFLDRVSLALFVDAAHASCPMSAMPACSPSSSDGPTLASTGAELNLDSALQFDVPYRFRLGIARPVHGAAYAAASSLTGYATLGLAF